MKLDELFQKATAARDHSRFSQAEGIYKKILRSSSLSSLEKAEALLGQADVQRIQGKFRDSLTHYDHAFRILKTHDPDSAIDAQVGWALAARAVGRPKEALVKLRQALPFYRKDHDRHGEAFVHWALGGTLRIAGGMRTGLKELQTALRMFKSLKESEGIAYTCCALGGIFRMLGRYGESGKYYREANRRMRQRKDTFGIAYSYCGLGNVERMAGRFKAALPFYKKAEKLYGTIGDQVSYAYTLWSIGTAYKMLGQYDRAWAAFLKADDLFKKTGDRRGRVYVSLSLTEIGTLSYSNGLGKKAFNYLKRKGNSISSKGFLWEQIHEKALIHLILHSGLERIKTAFATPSRRIDPWWKEKKNETNEWLRMLKGLYKKLGSRFYPNSFPVNWP